jgi:tripartite-type tricarboxylate transporter receptor subunit TctC
MIVPLPAGGSIDIMARVLAKPLSAKLGQQFIIENRSGFGSVVGTAAAATAPPDGYTLLFGSVSGLAVAPAVNSKIQYDVLRDFTTVSLVGDLPFVLLVHPSVAAKTVSELVALAKSQPGKLNYSSFGNATTNHVMGEMLNSMAGIKLVHVPYRGGAPALTALLAGEVQVMLDTTPAAMPRVQSGSVRALGITSAQRNPSYPNLPTVAEQGLPGLIGGAWIGVLGPAGMPESVVSLLNREIVEALKTSEMRAEFARNGLDLIGSTPKEFSDFMRREVDKWSKVARDNNIRVTE